MSKPQESIGFVGQVNIDYVQIITSTGKIINVLNQVSSIEIFEDIFSPLITGQITMTESFDFIGSFPFIGEEIVKLKVKTPTFPDSKPYTIDGEFYVYKITNQEQLAHRKMFYVLHFISLEVLSDINLKISKSYSGRVDEIVKRLITSEGLTSKKNYEIEQCRNSTKYISNYWSPIENLNFLTRRAQNAGLATNYVFFENNAGFHFISLDSMYKQPVAFNFIKDDYSDDGFIGTEYERILSMNVDTNFDYLKRIQQGFYSSKMVSHDLVTKKYAVQKMNYFDIFQKFNHLNPNPVSTKDVINRENDYIINKPRHYAGFNGVGGDGSNEWVLQHLMQMQHAGSLAVNITVPGRTSISAGQKVNLTIHNNIVINSKDTSENIINKTYSGNYIISACNHEITRSSHFCHLELIKDSNL